MERTARETPSGQVATAGAGRVRTCAAAMRRHRPGVAHQMDGVQVDGWQRAEEPAVGRWLRCVDDHVTVFPA